jgi:hypothetical protein
LVRVNPTALAAFATISFATISFMEPAESGRAPISAIRRMQADPCATVLADTLRVDMTFDVDAANPAGPVGVTLRLPSMGDTGVVLQLPSSEAGRSNLEENILDLHATTPGSQRPRAGLPLVPWLRGSVRAKNPSGHRRVGLRYAWRAIVGFPPLKPRFLARVRTEIGELRRALTTPLPTPRGFYRERRRGDVRRIEG